MARGHGVTGYAQLLLVHERLGCLDFFTKTADELVDAQFEDRAGLRPVYDAVVALLPEIGDCTVQDPQDLRLRPDPAAYLRRPGTHHPDPPRPRVPVERLPGVAEAVVGLQRLDDLDPEVVGWLRAAYAANV